MARISELAGSSSKATHLSSNSENDPESTQGSIASLWVYSLDDNTWSPILEPPRPAPTVINPSSSSVSLSSGGETEPTPRLGHSVVYDTVRRSLYMFGGNAGGKARLNDFWCLSVDRYVSVVDAFHDKY